LDEHSGKWSINKSMTNKFLWQNLAEKCKAAITEFPGRALVTKMSFPRGQR
jgi:hypothetical protein